MLSDVGTNCGAKLYSIKGGEAPPPSHMHKILLIMIYYIWSLAVHSAVLSFIRMAGRVPT